MLTGKQLAKIRTNEIARLIAERNAGAKPLTEQEKHDNGSCVGYAGNCRLCLQGWIDSVGYPNIDKVDVDILLAMESMADIADNGSVDVWGIVPDAATPDYAEMDGFHDTSEVLEANAGIRDLRDTKREVHTAIREIRSFLDGTWETLAESRMVETTPEQRTDSNTETNDYLRLSMRITPEREAGKGKLSESWVGTLETADLPNYNPADGQDVDAFGEAIGFTTYWQANQSDNPESAHKRVAGIIPGNNGFPRGDADRLDIESETYYSQHSSLPQWSELFNPSQSGFYGGSGLDVTNFRQDFDNLLGLQQNVVQENVNRRRRLAHEQDVPARPDFTRRVSYPLLGRHNIDSVIGKIDAGIRAHNITATMSSILPAEYIVGYGKNMVAIGNGTFNVAITNKGNFLTRDDAGQVVDRKWTMEDLENFLLTIMVRKSGWNRQGWQAIDTRRETLAKLDNAIAKADKAISNGHKPTRKPERQSEFTQPGEFSENYGTVLRAQQFVRLSGVLVEMRIFNESLEGYLTTTIIEYGHTAKPGSNTGVRRDVETVNGWQENKGSLGFHVPTGYRKAMSDRDILQAWDDCHKATYGDVPLKTTGKRQCGLTWQQFQKDFDKRGYYFG